MFLTLTAPSFGAVHTTSAVSPCHAGDPRARCAHGRPQCCPDRHERGDELVGTPLCPDCYDYEGAVLQNALTSELWRRTMIYTERQLAAVLGRTQADARRVGSARLLPGGRVPAPWCRAPARHRAGRRPRGLAPAGQHAGHLARACLQAAGAVTVAHPKGSALWGRQIDVQVLEHGDERARRVATYVAKYATKTSSDDPRLDAPVRSFEDLCRRELPTHLHRMVATALELGADPALSELNLARHAHRLGYGGHFLTKSRRYSTTFGALRDARVQWREARRLGDDGRPFVRGSLARSRGGLDRQGRIALRRPPTATAGRGEERSGVGVVHPVGVARCSEAKLPQAVRQGFVVAPPTSSSRHL